MGVYEPHPGECEMIRLTRFVAQSEGREPRRFDELPTRSWAGSGRPFDRLRVSGFYAAARGELVEPRGEGLRAFRSRTAIGTTHVGPGRALGTPHIEKACPGA